MKLLRHIALGAFVVLALPACTPFQNAANWANNLFSTGSAPQANTVKAAELLYTAGDSGLAATIDQHAISKESATSIGALDNKVYAALVPLRQAAEAGNSAALPALLAAYNAAFGNYYTTATSAGVAITVPTDPGVSK